MALNVEGLRISTVQVTIINSDPTHPTRRDRTLDVADRNAAIQFVEAGLLPGTYSIQLSAKPVDDSATSVDESKVACLGKHDGAVVEAGKTTEVNNLVLLCTLDGGQIQQAGGLRIQASTQLSAINTCGDLIREFSIGGLQTSVGSSVALVAVPAEPGVQVAWQAFAGSVSADNSAYTCPAIAGKYPLTATFKRADGCTQSVTETITCKGDYQGTCAPLPKAFGLGGTCSFGRYYTSPCHVVQNGCDFTIGCGGDEYGGRVTGEGAGSKFDFMLSNGSSCLGRSVDGAFNGTCTAPAGSVCEFEAVKTPPSAYCPQLPATSLLNVSYCGQDFAGCEVFQDGCSFQANCDRGARLIYGDVRADGQLSWFTTRDDRYYDCHASFGDAKLEGQCAPWFGYGLDGPSCAVTASANLQAAPLVCLETMPEAGFKLQGCGLDGLCVAYQEGCSWALDCQGQSLAGIATSTNSFAFTLADGKHCSGSVVAGAFNGSCADASNTCAFAPVARATDPACLTLPRQFSTSGCGPNFDCRMVQDGCSWFAGCGATRFSGQTSASALSWTGLNGYACSASPALQGQEYWGACTRLGTDGKLSECEDLTEVQGARLVLRY
jgi:hypothetical protein